MQWIENLIKGFGGPLTSIVTAVITIIAIVFCFKPAKEAMEKFQKGEWGGVLFALIKVIGILAVPLIIFVGLKHLGNSTGRELNNYMKTAKMIEFAPMIAGVVGYKIYQMKQKHLALKDA